MTCRHAPGDPNCSSHPDNVFLRQIRYKAEQRTLKEANKKIEELLSRTPNPDIFEIEEVKEIGPHLVMMVKYSACSKCSFDSKKVMVFFNAQLKDAIKWKRIDPHFAETSSNDPKCSPAPRARFPADNEGWGDAITYARARVV